MHVSTGACLNHVCANVKTTFTNPRFRGAPKHYSGSGMRASRHTHMSSFEHAMSQVYVGFRTTHQKVLKNGRMLLHTGAILRILARYPVGPLSVLGGGRGCRGLSPWELAFWEVCCFGVVALDNNLFSHCFRLLLILFMLLMMLL